MKIKIMSPKIELITPISELRDMEQRLELIGRVCYKSENKITTNTAGQFIKKIVRNGHTSVLEHCSVSVRIICSRTTSHQLIRHRIGAFNSPEYYDIMGSYSQESQRYCNYSKDSYLSVIAPEPILESLGNRIKHGLIVSYDYDSDPILYGTENDNEWALSCLNSYLVYVNLINSGWRPEDARDVLPNCTKTEIVCTYNLRQWRNFFKLRCSKHAQGPIRRSAIDILMTLGDVMPNVFGDQIIKYSRKQS